MCLLFFFSVNIIPTGDYVTPKEEGIKVEVNWQDADSSSAKGFRYSFGNEQESKVMLCGGHAGRAHGKKLQEL